MEKLNVALADSNISILLDAKNYFTDDNEINLIATFSNASQLKNINYIDALIFDISLSSEEFTIEDCCCHFSKKPSLIITTEEKRGRVFAKIHAIRGQIFALQALFHGRVAFQAVDA